MYLPLYVSGGGSGRGLGTWSYTSASLPHPPPPSPTPSPPQMPEALRSAPAAPLGASTGVRSTSTTLPGRDLLQLTLWLPKCGFRSILSSKSTKPASPQNQQYWSQKLTIFDALWSSSGPFAGNPRLPKASISVPRVARDPPLDSHAHLKTLETVLHVS